MGGGRVTQRGLTVVEVLPGQNLLLVRGAVPGARRRRRRGENRCLGARQFSAAGPSSSSRPRSRRASTCRSSTRPCAPSWLRAGRARLDQDARRGVRRRRQALAPEGHRPRPRRLVALADLDRRRHRIRPHPAQLHLQGQPQGAAGGAAQRAVGPCRARLAGRVRRGVFDAPVNQPGVGICSRIGMRRRRRWSLLDASEANAGKSFRNLARVAVMPAPRMPASPT